MTRDGLSPLVLLVAALGAPACVFLAVPPVDLERRPCAADGGCTGGFVCVDELCVAEGEGEGEGAGEGEGEGAGEGEGEGAGEGEGEGAGEGEGEGEGTGGPLAAIDKKGALLPDGEAVIVVENGRLDLVATATGALVDQVTVAALTSSGVRAVRACAVGGVETAVLATNDELIGDDDNGLYDVYRVAFGGAPTLVSRATDGGVATTAGGANFGAFDPQVADDCSTIVFAADSRIVAGAPPSGYVAGNRYFYAVSGVALPVPVLMPNASIALDYVQGGRLNRSGTHFTFPVGQENAKNLISYDLVSGTANALLANVGGDILGGCPLYDEAADVLLFESTAPLTAGDSDLARDLYLAFDPFGVTPQLERVGTGRSADSGPSNFFHGCMGATLVQVAGELEVVLTTTERLVPGDTDASADVYAATVDVAGTSLGALRQASYATATSCAPFAGAANFDRLLDVAGDGRFLLADRDGGDRALLGRMSCP